MSWDLVSFEELYAEPSRNGVYKTKEHHGSGTRIVNMGELFGYEFIGGQKMNRVQMTDAELERFGLLEGDLLFGRRSLVESGAGKCSIVEGLTEPATFESSIIRVRLNKKKALPKFYYYWFKSHVGRAGIRAIVTGTNVKGIRGSELKRVKVACPTIHEQEQIVFSIAKYDDLIENNRRRIQLLEESAHLLYKEWFIELRFPGHEHVKVVDGVPEGWSLHKVGDLLGRVKRKAKIKKEDYQSSGLVPCVDQSRDFIGGYIDDLEIAITDELPLVVFGDHTRIVKYVDFPFAPGADGTQLLVPKDTEVPRVFFFYLIKSINISNAFYARHFKFLKAKDVILPPKKFMNEFEETARNNMRQVSKLREYNRKLSEARDLLLPRLMNGKIAV